MNPTANVWIINNSDGPVDGSDNIDIFTGVAVIGGAAVIRALLYHALEYDNWSDMANDDAHEQHKPCGGIANENP